MSGPLPEPIRVEWRSAAVALVIIDRAARYNTLSIETLEALDEAIVGVISEPESVAIVLTGAGNAAFAAGADLREVAALTPRSALGFAARGQRVFDRIEQSRQIVFAAIDGACMGGGLDLALACDIRYASPRAVFAHPGAVRGIVTGFGGTGRLPRLVGRGRAVEMFATGRRLNAAEARAIGLVNRVVEDPVSTAILVAHEIAERAPDTAACVKRSAVTWWRNG